VRYEAQLIAHKFDKSLEDATEIAQAMRQAQNAQRQRSVSSKRKVRQLKAERRHDRAKKESIGTSALSGLPMQGGAPGLGKRK